MPPEHHRGQARLGVFLCGRLPQQAANFLKDGLYVDLRLATLRESFRTVAKEARE